MGTITFHLVLSSQGIEGRGGRRSCVAFEWAGVGLLNDS